MTRVCEGLKGQPGWSAAQYKIEVQQLVDSLHGAVIADELYSELGGEEGAAAAAVQAMVKANMLAYRPPSGGAVCYLKLLAFSAQNGVL